MSVKKDFSESEIKKVHHFSTHHAGLSKKSTKYYSSPYLKCLSKNNSIEMSLHKKSEKSDFLAPKVIRKEVGNQSCKVLKKVPKQRLTDIDKRHILK